MVTNCGSGATTTGGRGFAGLLWVLAAGLLLPGCATYNETYTYMPRPAQEVATVTGGESGTVRTLASIIGLNDEKGPNPAMEVQMQVWNATNAPIRFDPRSLQLIAANTAAFPAPQVDPAQAFDVAAGQTAHVRAVFPFPGGQAPGSFDLRSLTLNWVEVIAGKPIAKTATFRRFYVGPRYPYYDPYWDYPYYGYPGWGPRYYGAFGWRY